MKRVNLFEYFELAEVLARAKRALASENTKGGNLYFALIGLPTKVESFIDERNGFSTCKHSAAELRDSVKEWLETNIWRPGSDFPSDTFDADFRDWQYQHLLSKIDTFRSVFEAECHDVDFYSVGQVAIYKTRELVANASHTIPEEFRVNMPAEALKELDEAGRCLAFNLPTACGFHALRGTEIVIEDYLRAFGVTKRMVSWNEYIRAAEALADEMKPDPKPSKKVTAMLDRMKSLDRNPLMHPRDELDAAGADQLFSLAAITIVEMVKDIVRIKGLDAVALIAANAGAELPMLRNEHSE